VIALLFPGQGAQTPGFLHQLPDHPQVRATLAQASEVLAQDVALLDTALALQSTVAVQLALLIAGVAAARALHAEGVKPSLAAGLSIGAYAAAVTCDALDFSDALKLVQRRAQLMEQAYPSGYGLAALVGLNEQQVGALAAAVREERHLEVYLANLNGPRQIVVAGSDAGLDLLLERARQAGARRAERLAVSVPSHCELLADAAQELARLAATVSFRNPRIPYIGNRGARALRRADAVRDDLVENLRYPVRWHDALRLMVELGTDLFIEAPPGQVLTGLLHDSMPELKALTLAGGGLARTVAMVRRYATDDPAQTLTDTL
jgi:malonate decarboxylase epsilon subunit